MVIKTNDTYLCTTQIKDKSDISKDFGRYDIFTKKDAISGFKSSPWAGLSKLVNIPLDSSIFAVRYHNLHYWFYDSIYIARLSKKYKKGNFSHFAYNKIN